jgi:hypothetical protein
MRFRIAGIAVALISTGCGTSEDVKKTGIVWQGTVAARYDQLASCLSKQTTLYYKGSVRFDTNARRATVTFSIPVTGIPVEVYDLRQTSENLTEVTWSTRLERGRHEAGKPYYLLDRCGVSPLPAASAPAAPLPAASPPPSPTPLPAATPNWAPEPATDAPSDL